VAGLRWEGTAGGQTCKPAACPSLCISLRVKRRAPSCIFSMLRIFFCLLTLRCGFELCARLCSCACACCFACSPLCGPSYLYAHLLPAAEQHRFASLCLKYLVPAGRAPFSSRCGWRGTRSWDCGCGASLLSAYMAGGLGMADAAWFAGMPVWCRLSCAGPRGV